MKAVGIVLLTCYVFFTQAKKPSVAGKSTIYREAVCVLQGKGVTGIIYFKQTSLNGHTQIYGDVNGLEPGKHGMHIHRWGNLTNGCDMLGGHYNPLGKKHGDPSDTQERHMGDLGNIEANDKGFGRLSTMNDLVKLGGPHSVIGRSFDIHENEDDLGKGGNEQSLKNGNSSEGRVACCVIGLLASN